MAEMQLQDKDDDEEEDEVREAIFLPKFIATNKESQNERLSLGFNGRIIVGRHRRCFI